LMWAAWAAALIPISIFFVSRYISYFAFRISGHNIRTVLKTRKLKETADGSPGLCSRGKAALSALLR
jgi:hypothetical protein